MSLRALAGCLLLALTTVDAAAARWFEVKSAHFTVISDSNEKRARAVAWQFEQIRAAITRVWPSAVTDLGVEVFIYGARNEDAMRALAPRYFEGRDAVRPTSAFGSAVFGHFVALRTDLTVSSRGEVNPYLSSYWSYAGLVVRATYARKLPLWFERGVAEVLSNTVVRDEDVLVGQIIPWHLQQLRGVSSRPTLEELLAADRESGFMKYADRMARFDAAAWSFVHYLMFGKEGKNLQIFDAFTRAIRGGADANDAVQKLYGGQGALRNGLAQYVDQSLYMYQRFGANVAVDMKSFQARELPAQDAAVALARLHTAMRRPVEARAQLAAAGQSAAGAEIEGLLLDGENKRAEALSAYTKASQAEAASFYGEYRFAQMSWPEEDGEEANKRLVVIEKSLRRATRLNPGFAPAHALHAQALTRLDLASDALPVAQRAVTLEPFEPSSHLALAGAYWSLEREEDAIASAKRALGVATTAASRQHAQRALDFYSRQIAGATARAQSAPVVPAAATETLEKQAAMPLLPFEDCEKGDLAACRSVLARSQTPADVARTRALLDKHCKSAVSQACELLKNSK